MGDKKARSLVTVCPGMFRRDEGLPGGIMRFHSSGFRFRHPAMANFTEKDRRALVVVGLIASVAFLLLAFLIRIGFSHLGQNVAPPVPLHELPPPRDPAAREKLARETAEKVLAAKGWKQWLPLVRDRSRVEAMMRRHHELQGHGLCPAGTTLLRMSDAGSPDRVLWYALYRLPDGEIRPAAFLWSEGAFRFDWESWSAHGSIAWKDWLELKPQQEHELRVDVESAGERPGIAQPKETEAWTRVTLAHRDSTETAEVWLADENTRGRILGLMAVGQRVPVTVKVAWTKAGDTDVAVVRELVHAGWSP